MRNGLTWGESVINRVLTFVALLGLLFGGWVVWPRQGHSRPLLVPFLVGVIVLLLMLCHGAYLTWREDTLEPGGGETGSGSNAPKVNVETVHLKVEGDLNIGGGAADSAVALPPPSQQDGEDADN